MRKIIGAPEELYAKIAAEFAAAVEKNPNAAFAFTAVDVPVGALEAIAASGADFSGAQAFNACEYVGDAAAGEHSQAAALNAALYEKTSFAAVHVPAEGEDYDAAIREAGGLDLVLLGIGERGHVAFCEPGAEFGSGTFTMKLADITRKNAAEQFGSLDATPTHGVTMGISTLLAAKRILLIACGAERANAAQKTIEGRPETFIPASFLQLHTDVTVFLDLDAASKL